MNLGSTGVLHAGRLETHQSAALLQLLLEQAGVVVRPWVLHASPTWHDELQCFSWP